jgi:cyclophilin family peptidyl-prolyl cis-trans isomerase
MHHGVLALLVFLTGCASNPRVELDTTLGAMTVELDREHAPISVENFLKYVERGSYDACVFHRVVPNFVAQAGGYSEDLTDRAKADAAKGIADQPIANEWQQGLKNLRGTIAMAREEAPDTATREFYFNLKDNPKLDTARPNTGNAGYAVFGRIVRGLDTLDRIAAVPTQPKAVPGVTDGSMENVPTTPVVIRSIRRSR